ncbi:CynX/NimT family MFS transporter [Pseudonocardia acaciae]|uniref:CynX/NimT family MFS transporter n=1 Tax=Pseudonocardia acaciae TaxID=551276 RepID=UPI00055D76C9|nr:MFS transporter [Pseudonocardia acaciae]
MRLKLVLAGIGVVLVSTNLRPAITAVSPLIAQIQAETGFSSTALGLLTTVPLLCFAALSMLAPRVGRRFGMEATVAASMVLLIAGFLLRLVPSTVALFAGTVVVSVAITAGNVLLPALIKRDFPGQVGVMTGLYTMGLNIGPAAAAGLTVPVQQAAGLSWRGALAMWAVAAGVGLLAWLPLVRAGRADGGPAPAHTPPTGLWRQPLAWALVLFLALLSMFFYSMSAWLPKLFIDAGMTEGAAGWMLSIVSLVAIPFALLAPILGERTRNQVWLTTAGTALMVAGLLGVLVSPTVGTVWWMVILGVGAGATTGIAFVLVPLRSPDARVATQVTATSQTFGYVLAAAGPLAVGALHDASASWTGPVILLIAVVVVQSMVGLLAGRERQLVDGSETGATIGSAGTVGARW